MSMKSEIAELLRVSKELYGFSRELNSWEECSEQDIETLRDLLSDVELQIGNVADNIADEDEDEDEEEEQPPF